MFSHVLTSYLDNLNCTKVALNVKRGDEQFSVYSWFTPNAKMVKSTNCLLQCFCFRGLSAHSRGEVVSNKSFTNTCRLISPRALHNLLLQNVVAGFVGGSMKCQIITKRLQVSPQHPPAACFNSCAEKRWLHSASCKSHPPALQNEPQSIKNTM